MAEPLHTIELGLGFHAVVRLAKAGEPGKHRLEIFEGSADFPMISAGMPQEGLTLERLKEEPAHIVRQFRRWVAEHIAERLHGAGATARVHAVGFLDAWERV